MLKIGTTQVCNHFIGNKEIVFEDNFLSLQSKNIHDIYIAIFPLYYS